MNRDLLNRDLLWGAIGLLPPLFGGIVWLTSIHSLASESAQRLDSQERKIRQIDELADKRHEATLQMLTEIRDRTIRIETRQGMGR